MATHFSVHCSEDAVSIRFMGEDVLSWTIDEWTNDPKVVLNIVEYIQLAHTQPAKLYGHLARQGKLS